MFVISEGVEPTPEIKEEPMDTTDVAQPEQPQQVEYLCICTLNKII
jgi:hypothetical protein